MKAKWWILYFFCIGLQQWAIQTHHHSWAVVLGCLAIAAICGEVWRIETGDRND